MTRPIDVRYSSRIAQGCNCVHLPEGALCVVCASNRPNEPKRAGAWDEQNVTVKDEIDRRWP